MAADRVEEIAALLVEAGQAHRRYEQAQLHGETDKDWARWYAGYVVEQGISALVGHVVTVDALAGFFADAASAYQRDKPGGSWAAYAAARLLERCKRESFQLAPTFDKP